MVDIGEFEKADINLKNIKMIEDAINNAGLDIVDRIKNLMNHVDTPEEMKIITEAYEKMYKLKRIKTI